MAPTSPSRRCCPSPLPRPGPRRLARQALADGVTVQQLYAASPGLALGPGQPLRVRLIVLADGAVLTPDMLGPAPLDAPGQALRFLRESAAASPAPSETAFTLRDADAGWPDFAPGIQRRVLWQQGGQAALLYFAQAGAQVPMHSHGHDEECLMLQGELYLDDLLLLQGDYQLAPAGSGQRITATDTGVVIYAHGDLDLQFGA